MLVVAHGNSIRSIVMVLDQVAREKVPSIEIATGVPIVYEIAPDARVAAKETRA